MSSIVIATLVIITFSLDGIFAFFSISARRKEQENKFEKITVISNLLNSEPKEELNILRSRKNRIQFPIQVLERGGFTGRGSPFLTRNEYSVIEDIDKSIERIIKK